MAVASVSSIDALNDFKNLDLQCEHNTEIEPNYNDFELYNENKFDSISKSVDICEETVNPPGEKVTSHDFDLLKKLGKGGYGQVFLAKKVTGLMASEYFAMKVVKKARLVTKKKDDTKYAMTERNILEAVNHPFLVKLYFAFQTNHTLFMVLEYLAGGELFMHLERQHTLTEDESRFYLAEITLALGHLHSIGVIYRDLKSENVMLDRHGHVKLTDFGLSKERNDDELTHSFCGTVEYMAPEILQRRGHGPSVDWWSMGILLYDMLIGSSPFAGGNRSQVIQRVINAKLSLPRFLSESGKHLLKNLLNKNPKSRLGGSNKDVEDIKRHYFFKSINWDKVLARELKPPFVPTLSSRDDVSLFDKDIVSEPCVISPITADDPSGYWFENFSYVSPQVYLEFSEHGTVSRQRSRSGLSHCSRMVKIKVTSKRERAHLESLPFLTQPSPQPMRQQMKRIPTQTVPLSVHEQVKEQVVELQMKLSASEEDRERLRRDLRKQRELAIDQSEFNREVHLRYAAEKRIRDLERLNALQTAEIYALKRDPIKKPGHVDAETQWHIADYKTPEQVKHRQSENDRRRKTQKENTNPRALRKDSRVRALTNQTLIRLRL